MGSAAKAVMNVREASGYLGVSPDTLYKYALEGKVPAFKLGSRWKFQKSSLDRWMEAETERQQKQIHNMTLFPVGK